MRTSFGWARGKKHVSRRLKQHGRSLRMEPMEERAMLSVGGGPEPYVEMHSPPMPASPGGTIYVVDSLDDVVAADGKVTLREAIEAANTNAPVFDAPAGSDTATDVIRFAPSLAGGVITLDGTLGQLEIRDDLTSPLKNHLGKAGYLSIMSVGFMC